MDDELMAKYGPQKSKRKRRPVHQFLPAIIPINYSLPYLETIPELPRNTLHYISKYSYPKRNTWTPPEKVFDLGIIRAKTVKPSVVAVTKPVDSQAITLPTKRTRPIKFFIPQQQTPKLQGYHKIFHGKHNRELQTYDANVVPQKKKRQTSTKAKPERSRQVWNCSSSIENFINRKCKILRGNKKPFPKYIYNEQKEAFINFGIFGLLSILIILTQRSCSWLYRIILSFLSIEENSELYPSEIYGKTFTTLIPSTIDHIHLLFEKDLHQSSAKYYYIESASIFLLVMCIWIISNFIIPRDNEKKRFLQKLVKPLKIKQQQSYSSPKQRPIFYDDTKTPIAHPPEFYKIFVEIPNKKPIVVKIHQLHKVADLKILIEQQTGYSSGEQTLYNGSKKLCDDNKTVFKANIHQHTCLNLKIPLRGGAKMSETTSYTKPKQNGSTSGDSSFANINLNVKHKCSPIIHSFGTNNNPPKLQTWDTQQLSKDISSKLVNSMRHEVKEETYKRWKDNHNSSSKACKSSSPLTSNVKTNSSTLSLHIAAYENSIEAVAAPEKLNELSSNISFKQLCVLPSSSDSFEYARQQTDVECTPQIMQFKATQKLFNPNQMAAGNAPPRDGIAVNSQPLEEFSQGLVDSLDALEDATQESNDDITRKRKTNDDVVEGIKRAKSNDNIVDEEDEEMEVEPINSLSRNSLSNSVNSLASSTASAPIFKNENARINFAKLQPILTKYGIPNDIQVQLGPRISTFKRIFIDQLVNGMTHDLSCIESEDYMNKNGQVAFMQIVRAFHKETDRKIGVDLNHPTCQKLNCIQPYHYNIVKSTGKNPQNIHVTDRQIFLILQPFFIEHGVSEHIQEKICPMISKFPRNLTTQIASGVSNKAECIIPETTMSKNQQRLFIIIVKAFNNRDISTTTTDMENPLCENSDCIHPFHYIPHANQQQHHDRDQPIKIPKSLISTTDNIKNTTDFSNSPPINMGTDTTEEISNENIQEDDSDEEVTKKVESLVQMILQDAETPSVIKENEQAFTETLKAIFLSNTLQQETKCHTNVKENFKIAQIYATENIPLNSLLYSSRQAYNKTINFISQLVPLSEMSCTVNRFRKQQNLPEYTDQELNEIFAAWKIEIFKMAASLVGTDGFKSDKNGWAMGLHEASRKNAAISGLRYACYCISQETDLATFSDPAFHISKVEEYANFLDTSNSRVTAHLPALINYIHGKCRTNQEEEYNDKEFLSLKAGTIMGTVVNIGVFLKLLGIFELSKSSFSLSSEQYTTKLYKKFSQNKVSSSSTCYPIMLPDIMSYFEETPCDNVIALQARVLLLLGFFSGWRIGSILSVNLSPHKQSPGIRLGDLKFTFIEDPLNKEDPIVEITVKATFHKAQTNPQDILTFNTRTNGTNVCLTRYLLFLLEKMEAFDQPLCESIQNRKLKIKNSRLRDYLFVNTDSNKRFKKDPLSIYMVDQILRHFAEILKISKCLISFKSLRKGFAVCLAFRILEQFKGLTSVMDIVRILKGTNWKSDAAVSYLTWGENDLQSTIDRYRSSILHNRDLKPEDVHVYLKDIGASLEIFFDNNSATVEHIMKQFEKPGATDGRHRKRLSIICNLNLFCFLYSNGEVRRTKPVEAVKNISLDFEESLKYTPYPAHNDLDGFDRHCCPFSTCSFKLINSSRIMRQHFDEQHNGQQIPCHKCDVKFNCVRSMKSHERVYHSLIYVCKKCSFLTTPYNIKACLKENHPVGLSSSITIKWKPLERSPTNMHLYDSLKNRIPDLDNQQMVTAKPKSELLLDLESFHDRPQIGAGIIIALLNAKYVMPYLTDVEFVPFMKYVNENPLPQPNEINSELLALINDCHLTLDIQTWSKQNVCVFVNFITGLEECAKRFVDEEIDGKALIKLNENDLNEMGFKIGVKVKLRHILKLIHEND